ncbi:MAG TPA: hypothetical protein VJZ69_05295, partial [Clostridia bacterium]|nr:hypothetical protein [Clostridia bacterium]
MWGATLRLLLKVRFGRISIHAPRVGSDTRKWNDTRTPKISIHAPRVGSDLHRTRSVKNEINFNPRSPCGERLSISDSYSGWMIFQSTLPVWGAT